MLKKKSMRSRIEQLEREVHRIDEALGNETERNRLKFKQLSCTHPAKEVYFTTGIGFIGTSPCPVKCCKLCGKILKKYNYENEHELSRDRIRHQGAIAQQMAEELAMQQIKVDMLKEKEDD